METLVKAAELVGAVKKDDDRNMRLLSMTASGKIKRQYNTVTDDFVQNRTPLISRARLKDDRFPVNNGIWVHPDNMARKIFYHINFDDEQITRMRLSERLMRTQKRWAINTLRECWNKQRDAYVFSRVISDDARLALCWVSGYDVMEWDLPGLQGYLNFLFEENLLRADGCSMCTGTVRFTRTDT